MDGTIPRGRLPQVLSRITELSVEYGLGVANVFHAGDGNLHPLILYDADIPGQLEKAEAFGAEDGLTKRLRGELEDRFGTLDSSTL